MPQIVWNVLSTYSGLLAGNAHKLIKWNWLSSKVRCFDILGKVSKSDWNFKCLTSASLSRQPKSRIETFRKLISFQIPNNQRHNLSSYFFIFIFPPHTFIKYKKKHPRRIFFEKVLSKINSMKHKCNDLVECLD